MNKRGQIIIIVLILGVLIIAGVGFFIYKNLSDDSINIMTNETNQNLSQPSDYCSHPNRLYLEEQFNLSTNLGDYIISSKHWETYSDNQYLTYFEETSKAGLIYKYWVFTKNITSGDFLEYTLDFENTCQYWHFQKNFSGIISYANLTGQTSVINGYLAFKLKSPINYADGAYDYLNKDFCSYLQYEVNNPVIKNMTVTVTKLDSRNFSDSLFIPPADCVELTRS
jgi:hypothetical protein